MKFLLITRKWPPAVGGMETYSMELADGLRAEGHEVVVLALPGRADGSPPGMAGLLGFGLSTAWQLMIRRYSADAVIGGDMAVWPLVALAASGGRRILAAHGTDVSLGFRPDIRGRLYRAYLWLGAKLLRRGGVRVAANSRATGARARALGFAEVRVIPLGCRPGAEPDVTRSGRNLLFAGRLQTRKGLSWFVDEVLPHLPADIRLRVAGPRWDASEARVLDAPRVDYLGPLKQDALFDEMSRALAVVIPNVPRGGDRFEGFGLVAVEAAAMGAPALAARLDGFRTSVLDGRTGTLLTAEDAGAWIAEIVRLAALDAEAMAALRRRTMTAAREAFNWERVARETAELSLKETVSGERRHRGRVG